MALVLCTGADRLLMETRKLILESAGHCVIDVMSVTEVENACAENTFDVAVIGQGIARDEKQRIVSVVRESCPSVKVLELYTFSNDRILAAADDALRVPSERPLELAERVSALATATKRAVGNLTAPQRITRTG